MLKSLRQLAFLAMAILIASCSSDPIAPTPPVEKKYGVPTVPQSITLGEFNLGDCTDTLLRISNTGEDTLTISSISFDPSVEVSLLLLPLRIAPGAYHDFGLRVCFADTGNFSGSATLHTSARDTLTRITLTAHVAAKAPSVGTTYTYENTPTDADGTPTGATSTTLAEVTATDRSIYGKTGVTEVVEGGEITLFKVEADGDVSLYHEGLDVEYINRSDRGWWKLPVSSHKTGVQLYKMDTTVIPEQLPIPVKLQILETADWIATEEITVAGKKYSAERVRITIAITTSVGLGSTAVIEVWYSPALKYNVKQTMRRTTNLPNDSPEGYDRIMTNFTL